MAKSNRERFESEKNSIQQSDEITDNDTTAIIEFLRAKDPEDTYVPHNDTMSDGTLARYGFSTKRIAQLADFELTDCSPDELNQLFADMHNGDVSIDNEDIEDVKDEGLTKGSLNGYQSTMRKFYAYHEELDIEKSEIALYEKDSGSVDERDIFDKDDIEAIRNAASHPRDSALIDMLLYTGQRLSAILGLRRRDINIEDGTFRLNEEAGDLKGASGKRPLLYAEKSVREWYNAHPCKDEPDAHFITHKYDWKNKPYEAGEKLHQSTVHKQLERIGDSAGVDKPVNAHNFRHTFVTVCKRDYEMDNDTIKRIIGHDESSKIMEEVYSHLTDDDIINKAERATGISDEEPESTFTPSVCDVCGEPVTNERAKACENCGTVFTPDARAAKDKAEDDIYQSKGKAETDEEEEAVDKLRELIKENPELLEELTD
jgi:integrase/recombinase XerD